MKKVENPQSPRQRKQHVEQDGGIESHRVPLREKGQSGVVQRIPQRDLPLPKALFQVPGQRMTKLSVVAVKERMRAKDHVRVSHANNRQKEQDEQPRCQRRWGKRADPGWNRN